MCAFHSMNGVRHSSSGVLCSKESNLTNFLHHQIAPNVFCSIELIIFKILALSMLLLWICSCACISLDERCTLLDERRTLARGGRRSTSGVPLREMEFSMSGVQHMRDVRMGVFGEERAVLSYQLLESSFSSVVILER